MINFEKLGDIANIQIGKTPSRSISKYWGTGNSWVSISDIKCQTIISTKEEITDLAVSECGCKLLPKGTLMMSFKLSIGKVAFAGKDLYTNEAICGIIIKDKSKLASEYLYYALKNTKFVGSNVAVKGSTLNTSSLNKLQIPVIAGIEHQLHIAHILSKAETLINQRKESIRLLDQYLKSTFLEMFGDPVRNEKGWEIEYLNKLVTKLGDGLHGTPIYDEEGEYFFINGNNLENGYIRTDEKTKRVSIEEYKKYNKDLNENTVLVSINGTLGRVAFYRGEKIILGKSACYFNLKNNLINQLFLYHFLQSEFFLKYVSIKATGSTISNVSLKTMRELPIISPPLALQTQFAQIVEKVECIKGQYQQSLQELEQLYGSLSQKAFRGELTIKENFLSQAAEPNIEYKKSEKF